MTPDGIDNKTLAKLPQALEVDTYVEVIEGYVIPDDEEYANAGLVMQHLQRLQKFWEGEQELATRALKDEYDRRREAFKPILTKIKTAMSSLKAITGQYVIEQRNRQQALLAAAAEAPKDQPLVEMALVKEARKAAAPQVKGLTQKVVNVAVVVDAGLVPDEYWRRVIDMAHIQSDVDAGVSIPGVEVRPEVKTTVRGGKA